MTTKTSTARSSTWRLPGALAAAAVVVLALSACGDDDDASATTTTEAAASTAVVETTAAVETTVAEAESVIEVTAAWARSSPMMVTAGAAYMVIANDGDADDALLSVTVDEAVTGTAELHETRTAEGSGMTMTEGSEMSETTTAGAAPMMEMVEVDRIEVPAGESVTLEPGGLHVMLLDLVEPLEAGTQVELTLTFELAGEVVVTAVVGDSAP